MEEADSPSKRKRRGQIENMKHLPPSYLHQSHGIQWMSCNCTDYKAEAVRVEDFVYHVTSGMFIKFLFLFF